MEQYQHIGQLERIFIPTEQHNTESFQVRQTKKRVGKYLLLQCQDDEILGNDTADAIKTLQRQSIYALDEPRLHSKECCV